MRTVLVLCLVLGGCYPKRDLPVEQINRLTSVGELMDVQGTVADPQFKKIDQPTYSDTDFVAFADAGERIGATSAKLKEFSRGAEFAQLADELNRNAKALEDAAVARDAKAASKALSDMKATCRSCHQKFK